MNLRQINFDMDGTIADLYGVENWLDDLINENPRPYEMARPMINFSALARQIHRLQNLGYEINIISWLSRNSSAEYDEIVANTKIEWLHRHLPSVEFNNITIVEYGTPKSRFGDGILFDDEMPNRREWDGLAYDEHNILEILRGLA